jgi:RNA polymerase sigma-70 factor (ECF subfamily)
MDPSLVQQARDGDTEAFSAIAHEVYAPLLRTARLITRDTTAAEDAVQETLLCVWRGLRGLRDVQHFDAWLRKLLVARCVDRMRHERRHHLRPVGTEQVATVQDTVGGLASRDLLDRGLRELNLEQRTVLVLTYYLDLPLAQAADALGIPVGTMKSRLDRARSALRATIEAQERPVTAARERYA